MNKFIKKAVATITLFSTLSFTMPVFAVTNSETIFTKENPSGENYKTVITTKTGDDVVEKETTKTLPIQTKITYTLNGQEIKPEDLAGQSGKVTIKIEYTNNLENNVYINGKNEVMYTPMMVITGAIIDNKNNTNISVTNGKIIENGNKSIVVAYSVPGMQESLKLNGELDQVEIPSSIEISMETTKFEMKNIMTYATPKVLESNIDWSKTNKLFDSVNDLQNATNELQDGTQALSDGINDSLLSGVKALDEGAGKLNDGATQLAEGTDKLYTTVKEKIAEVRELEGKYTNKEELAKQIADVINKELDEMMPDLEQMAKDEAEIAIKNNLEDLQNSVVKTSKKHTENMINQKVEEIKSNNGKFLSDAEEKQIISALKECLEKSIADIESSEEAKAYQTALENAVITVIKQAVGQTTKEVVSNEISKMKAQDLSSQLTDAEKAQFLADNQTAITEIVTAKVASKVQSELSSEVSKKLSDGTLTAKVTSKMTARITQLVSSGKSMAEATATANAQKDYFVAVSTTEIMQEVTNSLTNKYAPSSSSDLSNPLVQQAIGEVMTMANGVATIVLDKVEDAAPNMAQGAVDTIATKVHAMTYEQVKEALNNYRNTITQLMVNNLKLKDENALKELENNLQNAIVKEVTNNLKNNETLKGLKEDIKAELMNAVEAVADQTAMDLAEEYTETLAKEIANNMLEKTLSNKITNEVVANKISEYENKLNSKIEELDNSLNTAEDAVLKLNNGAKALRDGTASLKAGTSELVAGVDTVANGASTLNDGMHRFNTEGISKINNLVNGDLYNLKTRLQKLEQLSNSYTSFEGEETKDSVKFISIIDSVKVSEKDESNEDAIVENTDISIKTEE